MEILIDTNFILTSINQKIQLFENLKKEFPEYKITIPFEVLGELEKIKENKDSKIKERESAEIAIFLIKKQNIKFISLNSKNVDSGIVIYIIKNPGIIVATLDKELKERIRKKVPETEFLTIRQKTRILLE